MTGLRGDGPGLEGAQASAWWLGRLWLGFRIGDQVAVAYRRWAMASSRTRQNSTPPSQVRRRLKRNTNSSKSACDGPSLGGETFIDFPAGWGNRTLTDRAFDSAGIARRVALEIANIAEGADYVRHGLGIAFLPEFVVPHRDDLATLTVTGADLRLPISLATPAARTRSAAARALIEMIQNDVPSTDAPTGDGCVDA